MKRYFYNTIQKIFALTMIVGVVFASYAYLTVPVTAYAAANPEINYQGKLTTPANVAVADASYNMQFKLYTVASGGTAIWTETWCYSPDGGTTCNGTGTDNRIPLTGGLFSTMLGSTTPLTGVDFNQTLYLGVAIGGSGSSPSWDPEMTPRKILGTVPAAFVASTLQGLSPSEFLRSDTSNATSSATTLLGLVQSGAGKIAEFFGSAGASVLSVLSGGNVGIGTSSPYAPLSVVGQVVGSYFTATTSTASQFPYASTTALTVSGLNGLTLSNLTGTQCLHEISGVVSGTGSDCGSGGGTNYFTNSGASTYLSTGSNLGIGTTTPWGILSIGVSTYSAARPMFTIGSSTASGTTTPFIVASNGDVGIGTSSPYAPLSVNGQVVASYFTATTSTASQFPYASTTALTVSGLNGLTLSNLTGTQCLHEISGVVSGTGSDCGSGGGTNYFTNSGASTYLSTGSNLGIGTTTPWGILSIGVSTYSAARPMFTIGSSTASGTTTPFIVASNGDVGIGTSSPYAPLSVNGQVVASYFTATSTTATSTLTGGLNVINGLNIASTTDFYQNNQLLSMSDIVGQNLTYGYETGAGLSPSLSFANTAFGYQALASSTDTASDNVAIGDQALYNNLTASDNVAIGEQALFSNTNGAENIAIGSGALYNNESGFDNFAAGYLALLSNTTGFNNVAIGLQALYSNTIGDDNVANGVFALGENATGTYNVANGSYALGANTLGNDNVANGAFALSSNASGTDNVANGAFSLYNSLTGNDNVAEGFNALLDNGSATDTVAVGYEAGLGTVLTNNASQNNVFLGYESGYSNSTGNNNTLLGYQSGYSLGAGSDNIIIGQNIDATSSTATGELDIGNVLFGTGMYGGTSTSSSSIAGDIGIGTTSPWGELSVNDNTNTNNPEFVVGSTTATSDVPNFMVANGGNVGIATTSPGSLLSIGGVANFTAATSTLYGQGLNISNGCYAIDNTCIANSTLVGIQTFTSNGTFSVPAGVTSAQVIVTGGGGGGAAGDSTTAPGGAGGAGGTAMAYVNLTGVTTVSVTVGAAGAGASGAGPKAGSNGGISSFGTYASANGGGGGEGGTSSILSPGGIGGTATVGDVKISGGAGTNGAFVITATSQLGGASYWGGGAAYASTTEAYGGGGGAGISTAGTATAGGGGVVVVYEYGNTAATASAVGGANGDIQFNQNGLLGGAAWLVWNPTTENLGIASSTPWAYLSIGVPVYSATQAMFAIGSTSPNGATTTPFIVAANANVGIGSTTPYALLSVQASTSLGIPYFTVGSSTNAVLGTAFTILNNGKTGVGIANPSSLFSVNGNATIGTYAAGTAAPANGLLVSGYTGISTSTPWAIFSIGVPVYSAATPMFAIGSTTGLGVGTTTAFVVAGNANVGIGTSTPWSLFSIQASTTNVGGRPVFEVSTTSLASATSTLAFIINSNGSVGIGTSSPWRNLSVTGTVGFNNLTPSGAAQAESLCLSSSNEVISDSLAGGCISSAARFKQDITPLIATSSLDEVMQLQPVSFFYKPDFNGALQSNANFNGEQVGFIADQVQTIDPRLVVVEDATTTFEGQTYPAGTVQTVRYDNMTALLAGAIQQQQQEIVGLESATSSLLWNVLLSATSSPLLNTQINQSFIAALVQEISDYLNSTVSFFFARLQATLAVFNDVQTNTIETQTASITDGIQMTDQATGKIYCVTIVNGNFTSDPGTCDGQSASSDSSSQSGQSQQGNATGNSASAVASANSSGASTSSSPSIAPIITINGTNPAQVPLHSVYSDLGARITGPTQDLNLGITATGTVDTTTVGTYTIEYIATDQSGLTSIVSRTVNVYDPNAQNTQTGQAGEQTSGQTSQSSQTATSTADTGSTTASTTSQTARDQSATSTSTASTTSL